jgi:hypothetical protein
MAQSPYEIRSDGARSRGVRRFTIDAVPGYLLFFFSFTIASFF